MADKLVSELDPKTSVVAADALYLERSSQGYQVTAENLANSLSPTSTGSTTARTLAARFAGQLIDVRDFGAVVDGATDDTTAIQAALDAAGTTPVFLPDGTSIVDTITPNNGQVIISAGPSAILKRKAATSNHLINATSKNGIRLHNFKLDGNKAGAGGGSPFSILCNITYDVGIDSVEIINSASVGIDFRSGTNETNSTRSYITNCRIADGADIGIQVTSETRLAVCQNLVEDNVSRGIYVGGATALQSSKILIRGNTVVGNGLTGIEVPFGTGPADPLANNVVIANNIVNDNVAGAGTGNGIAAQFTDGAITGNVCTGNAATGLLCNGRYYSVTGNLCEGNGGSGVDAGGSIGCTVTGNVCRNNDFYGIELNWFESGTCVGNTVIGNWVSTLAQARAGIIVWESAPQPGSSVSRDVVVSGNLVLTGTNQQYGIYVESTVDRALVQGNNCNGAGSTNDIFVGNASTLVRDNITSDTAPAATPSIASATSITIPDTGDYFEITGTTNISSIVQAGGTFQKGRKITLNFAGILTASDGGGNMKLAGNFATSADDILNLVSDGTDWVEISRSAN